jgi:hypothetical protein
MKILTGTIEMYVGAPVTPWISGPKWETEIPDGKTAEQIIKEHFSNGMERLVDWKIAERGK